MKQIIAGLALLVTLVTGTVAKEMASPTAAPATVRVAGQYQRVDLDSHSAQGAQVAEASDFYCQRGASGGQYGSTCSKFGHASENWYQYVLVVCSDGLGDVGFKGPTRYVYTYPTNNWSFRGGCPLGYSFRYYTYKLFMG